jgi:hypothetical protein
MTMRSMHLALAYGAFALLLAACDGGSSSSPTATAPAATEAAQSPTLPSTADATVTTAPPASESGSEPFFYRTADEFASLVANEPYKVLFRITNGYAEPMLTITATRQDDGTQVSFEAALAEPSGNDAPGSYYPTNIDLPGAGAWTLTVQAGEDQVTIPVVVADAVSTPAG